MKKSEITDLMNRIKTHYSTFVIDDYRFKEWYKELKNYDPEDINRKLEEHMKSEKYGMQEPKLYFITKYLKTSSEKEYGIDLKTIKIYCNLCGKPMTNEEYDKHYGRCLEIKAILKLLKQNGKEATEEDINFLDDEKLEKLYDKYAKDTNKEFYERLNSKKERVTE